MLGFLLGLHRGLSLLDLRFFRFGSFCGFLLDLRFRFGRIGCNADLGLRLRVCGCGLFPVELDPALRHVELLVFRDAAHAESVVEDFEDSCEDEVLADFDADKASDFDFADVAH